MERHHVPYARALEMLRALKLHLVCGEEIRGSAALQGALLTSVNTGKRAFRGGVTVEISPEVPLCVPWPKHSFLNQVVEDLGAELVQSAPGGHSRVLAFGTTPGPEADLRVTCDGWRGGVSPSNLVPAFRCGPDFALGGIFAGALAVSRSFLSASEIVRRDVTEPIGFSLWRPDLSWLCDDAIGPSLEGLPSKLWLLGLGHLGQAYVWTIGLMPFPAQSSLLLLQDFDQVEKGNWSAGLLCENKDVGTPKTRMCAQWLEQRDFRTQIVERPFDENTKRNVEEPRVALCGFDNAESRRFLENAGFDLIVECSLGATVERYDRIVLRTFPDASEKARDIWKKDSVEEPSVDIALLEQPNQECGIVLDAIAEKAISSSFTGACASALVLAEVLKAIHGGRRCEILVTELRHLDRPDNPYRDEAYQLRVARNGMVLPNT